jgi:hypothetical protein
MKERKEKKKKKQRIIVIYIKNKIYLQVNKQRKNKQKCTMKNHVRQNYTTLQLKPKKNSYTTIVQLFIG